MQYVDCRDPGTAPFSVIIIVFIIIIIVVHSSSSSSIENSQITGEYHDVDFCFAETWPPGTVW